MLISKKNTSKVTLNQELVQTRKDDMINMAGKKLAPHHHHHHTHLENSIVYCNFKLSDFVHHPGGLPVWKRQTWFKGRFSSNCTVTVRNMVFTLLSLWLTIGYSFMLSYTRPQWVCLHKHLIWVFLKKFKFWALTKCFVRSKMCMVFNRTNAVIIVFCKIFTGISNKFRFILRICSTLLN